MVFTRVGLDLEVGGFNVRLRSRTFPWEICRHFGHISLIRALYLCGMRIKMVLVIYWSGSKRFHNLIGKYYANNNG